MNAMEALGVFAAQTLLIVLAIVAVVVVTALMVSRAQQKNEITVELLHKKYKNFGLLLKAYTLNKADLKIEKKKRKAEKKAEKSAKTPLPENKIFVIDFKGDVQASAVENLREEVTAVLSLATPKDEIVARVESPGGVVHNYGLAASQLLRFRERGIPLTICVDKVAASGGYLMACTANKILAAPFAIVGSIGVVAQVPNFNRILKKHDVDFKEYTAGQFKRTVSIFGEITEKGEEKFKEQLESTHVLFKNFVHRYRPQLDMAQVATGEYWFGEQAIGLKLVDKIQTSDEYLLNFAESHQIVKVEHHQKETFKEKLSGVLSKSFTTALNQIIGDLESRKWM